MFFFFHITINDEYDVLVKGDDYGEVAGWPSTQGRLAIIGSDWRLVG